MSDRVGAADRLRILVVPKWYPWPDRPVFGLFCREHARALATRHEVVVLASDAVRRPPFRLYELSDAVEDGIRTVRVRYRRPWLRPAAMACQLAGMLAARRQLHEDGFVPDVVHAHVYQAALPALVLGRLDGALVAVTEHYTGFQRGLVRGYDRLLARIAFTGADVTAPVSVDLARHLLAIAPSANVRVLPNTVDTSVFTAGEHTGTDGPPRLLTVGALAEKKGHVHLLDAVARLRDHHEREVLLYVVGDGELRGALERQTQRLGLAGQVLFHGELPKERVAELMREADLFVLPSLHETFGCVLIEALASGLPAVATRVGGVPEVLEPEAGTLVAPADPRALAEAIESMLARSFDPAALAREARERYGYEAFELRWSNLYAELGSRRGRISSAIRRRRASSP
jgi:glycosyltransferase involved in cell wall biosynthesis